MGAGAVIAAVATAVATAVLGTAGLLVPRRVAAEVGVRPEGLLGVAALALGAAWGGAAVARIRSAGWRNAVGVLVDAGLTALFLLGD